MLNARWVEQAQHLAEPIGYQCLPWSLVMIAGVLDIVRRCSRIERLLVIKALAASLAYLLAAYVFAPAVISRLHLRVPGTIPACDWALGLPPERYGIRPISRPNFSLTAAWLKPETARYGAAPKHIPKSLRMEYSMGNEVPITKLYFDNAYLGGEALIGRWTVAMIDSNRKDVRNRRTHFTYPAAPIYAALDAYANSTMKSKRGLVIGSQSPWLESFLLEYGASHVTTLEFGSIISEHPQISTFTPRNFTTSFLHGDIEPYDFAFTYSSIEHDGLGRYGDVLNPNGDLEMMARMLSVVKPGGFVYVGVPCCHDVVEWNAHRIYGPKRLPELFAGWKIVSVFPENEINVKRDLTDWTFQPVWLLQNVLGCSEDLTKIAGLFRYFK